MRIVALADVILGPGQPVGAGTMVDVEDGIGTTLVGSGLARPAKWERMPEPEPAAAAAAAEKPKPAAPPARKRGRSHAAD